MRATRVEVNDIGPIEHLEFQPGALTVLSGANGTGKSAVLEAIEGVFEGGHNPHHLRKGAKKGEVVFELDGGEAVITRTITEKDSTLKVRTKDGGVVSSPATFVKRLSGGFALDPIAFCSAKPKERAKFLMEAMPITFTAFEVSGATGRGIDRDYDLDGINNLFKGIYEERREKNVAGETLDGAIATMRKALPEDDEINWRELEAEAEGDLRSAKTRVVETEAAIDKAERLARTEAKEAAAIEIQRIRDEAQRQIDAVNGAMQATLEGIAAEVVETRTRQTSELHREIEAATAHVSEAREKAAQQARAEGARKEIARITAQRKAMIAEWAALDRAVTGLTNLKTAKLSEVPIPGVEVRDGEVWVDDRNGAGWLPFDRLNRAQQYVIAFQIAALKPGELGMMICDNAEALVGEARDEFFEAARNSPFQVIATVALAGQKELAVQVP